MKKILTSVLTIALVVTVVTGATVANFFDTETSTGNTFTAGSLDLKIDGGDDNVVKFNLTNMRPGDQPNRSYKLQNAGSITGLLDIEEIVVTSYENGCVEAEVEAGDTTCDNPGEGAGELQNVLGISLFVDYNKDGWFTTGDKVIFNGMMKDLPTSVDLNESLTPGQEKNITAIVNWWSTPNDNLAQGDSVELDITFKLAQ